MKERGKAVETYSGSNYSDYNYSASSDLPCKKHPSSSAVGICAYCLKDRLVKLVCSDCGEQRLSSCSCSEVSSYRNSCAAEVGSVARISFLIENERSEAKPPQSKPPSEVRSEGVVLLKRSSSTCAGGKRSGLWRIVRLFRKKKDKGGETSVGGCDERSELWVFDYMGVSRSRSLCSFRGGGGSFYDVEEGSDFAFSSAKISDVNGGSVVESERLSGFSEAEPRKSGFKSGLESDSAMNGTGRSVFPVKESDFCRMDESGFIDLKLDLSLESKPELSASDLVGRQECRDPVVLRKGGSCRVTVNDSGIRKEKKGRRMWRWIFRQHPNWRSSSSKKEEDGIGVVKP